MQGVYVRGRFLNLYLNYISTRWGPLGYNSCLKEAGLQKYGKIEDGVEYPVSAFCEIIAWLSREKGEDHVLNAGKQVALFYGQKNQEKDIKKALQRTAYAISECFRHAHISVHIEENGVKLYVGNINFRSECCASWIGVLKGIAEQTGHDGTVSEIECQTKNGKFCCFALNW
ncbi:MAG: hypothetical protein N3F63_02190 [Thermoplasmata archaeon]|nr:hypothetical protein [Thermoplasmata archaeon]